MAAALAHARSAPSTIPLLDASNLPAEDDWVLLESFHADGDQAIDGEADFDRFGQFRVTASFDE